MLIYSLSIVMKRLVTIWYAIKSDIARLGGLLINPKTPRIYKLVMIVTIFYVISPVDFSRDTIPLLGQIDDVALIVIVVQWLRYSLQPSSSKPKPQ